jgi:hypothetical protein
MLSTKKYALFDKNGYPLSFYTEERHKGKIPKGAVEINVEHWLDFINNPAHRKWNGSKPVKCDAKSNITWEKIRQIRNTRLGACDWVVLPDVEMTKPKKIMWLDYRQKLRDLPKSFERPQDVVWPPSPK